MADLAFVLPGDPETLTGGYGYDRRLKAGLEALGWRVRWLSLPGAFPRPDAADLAASLAALAALPAGSLVLADGLAYGALPAGALAALPLTFVALVHHPLALETGLGHEEARRFEAGERAALAVAQSVITTSAATAETLVGRFGVARARITVAEPGTDRAPPAAGGGGGAVQILSVGSVTPRKGHHLLLEALGMAAALDWRCRIVGSLERDPEHARKVVAAARVLGERIVFAGEVGGKALERLYDGADLFALASLHEGYGMVFAEALARRLPVIGFAAGAVPSVVPEEAGLLVSPGDVAALGAALVRAIGDAGLRRRLAAGAGRAAERLPTWEETAARVDRALRGALA